MKKSGRKYSRKLPEHYTSIDFMPILNWEKVHEDGDMKYLLVKQVKLTRAQKIVLAAVWKGIYDEYIKVFGFGDNFKRIIAKRIEIANLKLKLTTSKDNSIQNFIKRKEKELEILKNLNKGGKGDIYSAKMAIEKKLGIRIPVKDTSVREFYSYIKEIK